MTLPEERNRRINYLRDMIKCASEKGKVCDREKLLAEFCRDKLVSRRLALEYLDLLTGTGEVVISGEDVVFKGFKELLK